MKYDTRKKSIIKSVVWRILGVIVLATVVYFYTREWITTGLITIIHHATFLLVFYLHERVWLKVKIKSKPIIKAFTYEVILGMGLGGLIVLLITGQWSRVTQITITYTIIKLIMYYFYEKIWDQKKVVYVYMVADILHTGHLEHLHNAKREGNYLIVGVLTDKATMEKKPKPIISAPERFVIIKNLKMVDKVVWQTEYSPLENVKKIKPDVLMETTDHLKMPANDFVKSYGGQVVITSVPNSNDRKQSTTKIKKKIIKESKVYSNIR